MASITAHGAHEVARCIAVSRRFGAERLFVMTSDGRILTRLNDVMLHEFRVDRRYVPPTMRTMAGLTEIVENQGYDVKTPPS